jgi:hypothetical protein
MHGHANVKKSHCRAAISVDASGYLMQFLRHYDCKEMAEFQITVSLFFFSDHVWGSEEWHSEWNVNRWFSQAVSKWASH